jgi:hypothetical protein
MLCRARSQLHVCLLVQNGTFSGQPVAQLNIVCPPLKVGSLVAASFGTEQGNGPWPALLSEICVRSKCTALLHEKTVKELQEAQAETQKIKAELQEAQAETQKAKAAYQAELDAGQKWFDTLNAGSGKMRTGMSCVVQGPS